jgi:hypothetical protein
MEQCLRGACCRHAHAAGALHPSPLVARTLLSIRAADNTCANPSCPCPPLLPPLPHHHTHQASLIVADRSLTLWLMGNGDVLEAQDGVLGEAGGRGRGRGRRGCAYVCV